MGAINQHAPNTPGELDQLAETISVCGTLLLLASPWREPEPLSRVWCLFELNTAIRMNVPIKMRFTSSDQAEFLQTLHAGSLSQSSTVDVRSGKATVEADRQMILSKIEIETGFDEFNELIDISMRRSLQQVMFTSFLNGIGDNSLPLVRDENYLTLETSTSNCTMENTLQGFVAAFDLSPETLGFACVPGSDRIAVPLVFRI